ncbi:hypothetical protein SAMN02745217_04147 [Anaerocolumna xylanovorans DSM 12503]|uniref:Uncharacterized protein n=1 Tax=Anaerocolumna xylanovorans DSM 12503 TaxID=1121345 RepID=A0A1M7YLR9_9FIRM|nr:hypothetical protein SAMN02745217_04147 [Anaerocolumna xylanovorans DSM 12503]
MSYTKNKYTWEKIHLYKQMKYVYKKQAGDEDYNNDKYKEMPWLRTRQK